MRKIVSPEPRVLAATLTTLGLITLAHWPLRAQSTSATEAPKRVDPVRVTGAATHDAPNLDTTSTTASRLNMTVRDTPASVTVVNREVIEERGATDSQEALKSVPGVLAASPPGSAGTIAYRGFGTANITQLFNGITVQYDAIAARPIDSWIVDRIEAIGGASTFLFGAGAVGGSVNVVTKLADPTRDFREARLAGGSYKSFQVAAGINQRFGDENTTRHAVRLDASATGINGWVQGMERRATQVAASIRSEFTGSLVHTFAAEYHREEVDRIYWGTPLLTPTVGQGRINPATRFVNYNSADGFYGQDVHWLRSITDYRWSPATRATNTIYHYDAIRDYRNVETYTFNSANTLVTRASPLLQRHDQEVLGNRLEVTHTGTLGGFKSDWAAGFDYSVNKQTRFPRSLTLNVSTVDPVNFTTERFFDIPGMTPGFRPDRDNKVTTLALFVENRTRVAPALSVVTALRHDDLKLEGTNRREETISATNPAYFKRSYRPLTGRAAVVFDLARDANVYVQVSTAADPPAGLLATAAFSQVLDFDLTTGRQFEVGSKFNFAQGRGAATLAAYRITRKNLSMTDPTNPLATIPIGQQSAQGIEATVSFRPSNTVLLEANAAYVDAQFDDFFERVGTASVSRAGNVPPNVPAVVGNVWVSWRPLANLTVGADARYVSRRYGNTANSVWDDAYTLVGAFARYQLTPAIELSLRGRNLNDRVYASAVTGTPMFYLGAPRGVEVAIHARF